MELHLYRRQGVADELVSGHARGQLSHMKIGIQQQQ